MKVIHNERAVYLIFPNDAANIQHSADELAQIARGVEDTDALFNPIIRELFALEKKIKSEPEGGFTGGKNISKPV